MTTTTWIHLTARMAPGAPDLCREDTGGWLWEHLREAFPQTISATLMPDHPHLLLASSEPSLAEQRLARLLGQFGRRFGHGWQAARVAPAQAIRPGTVLARQVRYIALNPCRRALVSCPLAWPWSTHRDVIGACVDPWVGGERLARALGMSSAGFVARHHRYVSGDVHARVDGTPLPVAAESTSLSRVALGTVADAVVAATRTPVAAVQRRGHSRALFVALALDQGWSHRPALAELCACTTRTIDNLAASIDPVALAAARLCLGDARLRRLPPPHSAPSERRSAANESR